MESRTVILGPVIFRLHHIGIIKFEGNLLCAFEIGVHYIFEISCVWVRTLKCLR